MEQFFLPTLYCPFEPAISPYAERVDKQTMAWAHRFGLITTDAVAQRFRTARLGWLAAYLAPTLPLEALQLLSDWNTWAIMWDDACDSPDMRSQPERLTMAHTGFLSIFHTNDCTNAKGSLARALQDIRQRIVQQADTARLYRFIYHVEEFFAGCVWEATNRAQQRIPDVATYIHMRRLTSGMYTSLKLIEITDGINLPLEVWRHPAIEGLRQLATNAVCWANDIISLHKEIKRGDMHNLILALQIAEQVDLQTAINRVADLHNAEVHAFLAAEQALPRLGVVVDRTLERHTALLRSFMYGNLAWSAISGRYRPTADTLALEHCLMV